MATAAAGMNRSGDGLSVGPLKCPDTIGSAKKTKVMSYTALTNSDWFFLKNGILSLKPVTWREVLGSNTTWVTKNPVKIVICGE